MGSVLFLTILGHVATHGHPATLANSPSFQVENMCLLGVMTTIYDCLVLNLLNSAIIFKKSAKSYWAFKIKKERNN